MIQRIQSIFYLLAALCSGGLFYFPFATSNKSASPFMEDQIFNVHDHIAILIIAGLAILLPLVAIFLFKKRPVQIRMGIFTIIMAVLTVAIAALLFMNAGQEMLDSVQVDDGIGLYLPLGTIIFAALANRFVKKDETVVQSMDRLR